MKAVITTKYGGPEVLEIREIAKPIATENEVLVKIRAVSINDWDWAIIQGFPKFFRLWSGLTKPKTQIVGSDIAGVVEAVGKNVKKFKPGDEVFGDLSGKWGGFAEYVCTTENKLAIKPARMSFIDAAAIPQAGMLALQGLQGAEIKNGQKILINGAGGGVGTFAVQIAKLYEVEITGVDKESKLDMLRSIGFDQVIDYTKEDFTKNGKQYDLVLDAKTNRSAFAYSRALSRNGVYITVGGSLGKLLLNFILSPLVRIFNKKHIRIVMLKANKDLAYLGELYETGKLKTVIDGPYRLDDIVKSFEIFTKADHKGKIVLTV